MHRNKQQLEEAARDVLQKTIFIPYFLLHLCVSTMFVEVSNHQDLFYKALKNVHRRLKLLLWFPSALENRPHVSKIQSRPFLHTIMSLVSLVGQQLLSALEAPYMISTY